MPRPVISIIIPVYKAKDDFFALLRALRDQEVAVPYEIVLAEDASPDDTWERLQQSLGHLDAPFIRAFRLPQNSGPAAARNHAISRAQGDVLVLIDSDCAVTSRDYLARLYEIHLRHPDAIIGCAVEGFGRGYVAFVDNFCRWTNLPVRPSAVLTAGHLTTNHMLIPRAVWERIGPFDVALRTGEDAAFCIKAHLQAIPLRFENSISLRHHDRETWRGFIGEHYNQGLYRALSRQLSPGPIPVLLRAPSPIRWLLVPFLGSALTLRPLKHLLVWRAVDWRIFLALPGIFIGMLTVGVGVAVGAPDARPKAKSDYLPGRAPQEAPPAGSPPSSRRQHIESR